MLPRETRRAFTIWEVVVAIVVMLGLLALLFPNVRGAREAARRNQCTNKMHQIGIALQNHLDSYKRFPRLSTEPFPQTPGGSETGFSWLTRILPYMEEPNLYQGIAVKSPQFATIANGGTASFNANVKDSSGRHYSTVQLDALICPSFSGETISELTRTVYSNVPGINLKMNPPIGVAISNYVALSATDMARMRGDAADANGVILPRKSMSASDIKDGTATTLIACESREQAMNAWIDGSVNWVVGANPNSPPPVVDEKGYLTMPKGSTTALNVGGSPGTTLYLTKNNSPSGLEWAWGPSSQHSGGVVMHVYADAAVRGQTDDIDPTVYIRLITPADNEPVVDPAVNSG